MEIIDVYKETINLEENTELNYNLKPNSFAKLFFYDRAGVNLKVNISLYENASCEIYGLFHNEGKDSNVITDVIHKGKKSKCDQDLIFVNKNCDSSFAGKITFPKDVTRGDIHMLNKNLLLDDESTAFS